MSDDLVARLRHAWDERERQLAEDERVALEASRDGEHRTASGEHWHWVESEHDQPLTLDPMLDEYVNDGSQAALRSVEEYPTSMPYTLPHFVVSYAEEVPTTCAMHIARHDPVRVLAEVERGRRDIAAKRKLVEECEYEIGKSAPRSVLNDFAWTMLRMLAEAEGLA